MEFGALLAAEVGERGVMDGLCFWSANWREEGLLGGRWISRFLLPSLCAWRMRMSVGGMVGIYICLILFFKIKRYKLRMQVYCCWLRGGLILMYKFSVGV